MDTRTAFRNMMTSKPWENADCRPQKASDGHIALLKEKPVLRLPGGQIGRVELPMAGSADVTDFEFVVIIGELVFYVNTEGYSYPRYAILFSNLQPTDFS